MSSEQPCASSDGNKQEVSQLFGEYSLNEFLSGITADHQLVKIKEVCNHIDTRVWIRARLVYSRGKGKYVFIVLRDSGITMQAAAIKSSTLTSDFLNFCAKIPRESVIEIRGLLTTPPQPIKSCTISSVELSVEQLFVVSRALSVLPLQMDEAERVSGSDLPVASLETRLNNRVIDLRTDLNRSIFRVQHKIAQAFRNYMEQRDFLQVFTPKIISAASEGGANVFKVQYFDRYAFLAQSPQLYKQMCISADIDGVYTIGPVFRAEDSNTYRHLTEFTGLDFEMRISHDYSELVDTVSSLLIHIFDHLRAHCSEEIEFLSKAFEVEPFIYQKEPLVIPFWEAIEMLRTDGEEIGDLDDFNSLQEKRLGRLVRAKHKTDFYIINKYPLGIRPFYTMPDVSRPNYSNSFDIFMRGEEICSGAQRVHDAEFLTERAKLHKIDLETIKDYISSFQYGTYPHGGIGIGLERVTMFFLGIPNIRRVSMFPRDPHRIRP